jgi:hypothetical protein
MEPQDSIDFAQRNQFVGVPTETIKHHLAICRRYVRMDTAGQIKMAISILEEELQTRANDDAQRKASAEAKQLHIESSTQSTSQHEEQVKLNEKAIGISRNALAESKKANRWAALAFIISLAALVLPFVQQASNTRSTSIPPARLQRIRRQQQHPCHPQTLCRRPILCQPTN